MSYAKITALLIAAASLAKADREAAMVSMKVYMNDIGSNMKDYLSMEKANPNQSIPPGVLSAYAAKLTAKDDSYTTFFADIDDAEIHYMITGVPWYSSRLAPAIDAALKDANLGGDAATTKATSTPAATTTTPAATTEATTKATSTPATTTTPAATTTKATETTTPAATTTKATETTTPAATTKAAETTTKATETTKAAETTTKATETTTAAPATTKVTETTNAVATKNTVAAVSQITDGQIQATITQQTANAANKAVVGLGAGVAAAAAFLL